MEAFLFNILEQVDSTNNYAMQQVHAGMAKHGMCWMTYYQSAGKGQRGKNWESRPGESVLMSVAVQPRAVFNLQHFHFHAVVALACGKFLSQQTDESFSLKWPNDLYWRDRKAGGILIENIIRGNSWNWAVIGIGLNIHQEDFGPHTHRAVSLRQITGRLFNVESLARQLHRQLLEDIDNVTANSLPHILNDYNEHLYKKNTEMAFIHNGEACTAKVHRVDEYGRLHTSASGPDGWPFGAVQWVTEL
ncbi:MAG TPA: biotin--[acetyl-CoA-carboxylase] ligase [Ferruginibacter sp.]|nr:biotin--[acetyl-CoA-carboxylase] ligase [Ferruginibacter sp.]HRQ20603.1 biotin--[acetyl-CoA-carboxylase] ligase [Ferruginibacter sp.]